MNSHHLDAEANLLKQLRGIKVLVVEDNLVVASSLISLLELCGIQVVGPATTLPGAAAVARAGAFDIALIDLNLHGETSENLIAMLCEVGVPVVVVTGHDVEPDTAAKVAAVLVKPFRSEQLLDAIRQIVADGTGARADRASPVTAAA